MTPRRVARLLLFSIVFAALAVPARGQSRAAPTREELLERVRQLEAQLELMHGELAAVREALAAGGANASKPRAQPATYRPPQARPKPERKLPGFEVGPWRVQPYGTVYFNAFGNSNGSNNADIPLFAAAGAGNISASGRQTRLGVRIEGAQAAGAKLGGVFEADFFGGFPAIGVGEDFGVVRLRLAYARFDWERTSLLAGQDWVVFAPGNPVSIAAAAIPHMTAAGNLWARLPQVRVERRGGSRMKWLGQAAVLAPATGDFPPPGTSVFLWQPGAGARSRVPYFQARAAATRDNWFGLGKPATFGFSAHYGRARASTAAGNRDTDSVGAALDWSLPLLPHTTLAGEAFFGRNLAGFQGAVFQGINPDFAVPSGTSLLAAGPRGIGSRGGWAQLGFTPPGTEKLTLYGTYGLDDPRDADLLSSPVRDARLRNQAFAFSLLYRISPQLTWGAEFRRFETQYSQSSKRTDNHVNLGIALSF